MVAEEERVRSLEENGRIDVVVVVARMLVEEQEAAAVEAAAARTTAVGVVHTAEVEAVVEVVAHNEVPRNWSDTLSDQLDLQEKDEQAL